MYELALRYYIIYALLMTGVSIYSIHLFYTRNYLVNNSGTPRVVLFIALLLMIVFSASGDYWTYRMWYDTGTTIVHFEPIWETIRTIIPWGFDVFKLVLWGGCLLLFTIMCKWHNSDLLIAFSLFALFYMGNYSYARATIAYMLILFAYYLIVRAKEKQYRRWSLLLIIVILCVSIGSQMHRSMSILLAIAFFSFFLKPKKNSVIFLLLFFPVISFVFNSILFPYIKSYTANDLDTARLMESYLKDKRGIEVFFRQLLDHLPIFILFFISLFNILKKDSLSLTVKRIAFFAFNIVYFSFLFYTIKAGNGLTLFYRTLNMAYPFMIMTISYSMKHINNMYILTFILVVYKVLYTFLVMFQMLSNPNYLYNQVYERYLL